MPHTVRDNPNLQRYELVVDGHTAVAHYRRAPGAITFVHTKVPEALEGRGIGSTLARGALELARSEGLRVTAQCDFIKAYIAKHPDLVKADPPSER